MARAKYVLASVECDANNETRTIVLSITDTGTLTFESDAAAGAVEMCVGCAVFFGQIIEKLTASRHESAN